MTSDELENFDGDSLLHSLLLVSKHFGINTNAESLTASLPLVDDKLTPELFVRAAQRVGLVGPDGEFTKRSAELLIKSGK